MNKKHKKNKEELVDKPLPRNAYDNLFIPKQHAFENLFVGGLTKKLSDENQYFCIYSNYKEIEETEEKNK